MRHGSQAISIFSLFERGTVANPLPVGRLGTDIMDHTTRNDFILLQYGSECGVEMERDGLLLKVSKVSEATSGNGVANHVVVRKRTIRGPSAPPPNCRTVSSRRSPYCSHREFRSIITSVTLAIERLLQPGTSNSACSLQKSHFEAASWPWLSPRAVSVFIRNRGSSLERTSCLELLCE